MKKVKFSSHTGSLVLYRILLSWALCPTDIWTRGFGLLFIFFPDYPKTKPDKISKHTHLEMGLTKKEIIGSY